VNGKLVPLDYQLANGDVVEIMTTRREKGPTRDWLNPHLGYVKTSHAKQKIRQWFKKQQRTENIERGRELLEKELKQLGLKDSNRDAMARSFDYANADDFLAAIGYGGISVHHIALKLAAQEEQPRPVTPSAPSQAPASAVRVLGAGDMLTSLGKCCHPVPGDEIIGYITRGRGVTIHRKDCHNILDEDEKERLINVEWGNVDSLYPVALQVEAFDRVGLARDITTVVAEEKVNIASMTVTEHEDRTTTVSLTLETKSISQLGRLMTKIEGIKGVSSVTRTGNGAA
jgi:guanosine-3',5'-bis(diphosphate) 3'-pyrophosphohydrolase